MADALRRATRSGWARLAGGLSAGALAGAGQAPLSFVWGSLLALAAVFILARRAASVRGAAVLGWAVGTGYFTATLFWIVEPFLVDVARDGWMAPFALVFMAGGLALFWGGAFALAHWAFRAEVRPFGLALTWAGAELARAYVFTGFPWALVGYIWTERPPMQLASIVGPYGVTLLTLIFVAALSMTVMPPRRSWAIVIAAVTAFVGYGGGLWLLNSPVPAPDAARPVVRLIQPNAAQHLKWRPDLVPVFFRRQLDFTAAPSASPPDLIIWPETAVPYLLDRAAPALAEIAAAAGGVPVVLGIQRADVTRVYNSLVVLGPDGGVTHLYDKYHLVPFGEYMPLGGLAARFGIRGLAAVDTYGYARGPGAQLLDMGPLGHALPLICYEAIFPQDVNAAPARPDWLLQITNDAWFGRVAGPYQHLAQARVRAIEQGLPLVRSANTGVSAVIDAKGRLQAELPLNTAGWLDAALPPAAAPTPYSRTGDAPFLAFVLIAGAGLALNRFRYSH